MEWISGFWFPTQRYKPQKVVDRSEWVDKALRHVTRWNCAIDVGAYVGTITRRLVEHFDTVIAFEPLPDAFECLVMNAPSAIAQPIAIGSVAGRRPYYRLPMSGYATFKADDGFEMQEAEMARLDDLNLAPDFIKIDAEFTDEDVIAGALETLKKHRPVVMLEVKGRSVEMNGLMRSIGYSPVVTSKIDVVYTPD